MTGRHAYILMLAALLPLAGCSDTDKKTPAAAKAAPNAEEIAFANANRQWRETRLADLTKPDGWSSLIGLHWISEGPHYVGSGATNGIRIALGPEQIGMLDLRKDGSLRLMPARGAGLTLDDAPLSAATTLRSDADPDGPSRLGFDEGKGVATVIKRGDRHALRVKHADAPSRTGFVGLDYWPLSRDWVIEGRFIAHPPGKTLPIANIIGTVDETPNPGVVEFTHAGKPYRLEALDVGDDHLFLVFADRTNGRGGSYGAGRFLDADKPDAQGRVRLDFNRSYSPPCAFTAFATCPLPPNDNRLDLVIEAGEKTYAKPPTI